ncbi:hypothetical protein KJ991_00585 [Patescibacteria group bacterium]|nr:hypothetical protein [Patescibacteria group bacterium]MBU4116024.1 hypothetical protein [Patescibacteria group bacterium]
MIPEFVRPFLWSYDISKMNLKRDKKRIITNILNFGTTKATDWLFSIYDKNDIKENVKNPMPGEWSEKSLNFWSIVLNVESKIEGRKIK